MGDYERSTAVQVPPARLFSYLADVANLPAYLPRLTSATPTHDDESSSRLIVRLHTDRVEGPGVDSGLDEALRGLKHAVERAESR